MTCCQSHKAQEHDNQVNHLFVSEKNLSKDSTSYA